MPLHQTIRMGLKSAGQMLKRTEPFQRAADHVGSFLYGGYRSLPKGKQKALKSLFRQKAKGLGLSGNQANVARRSLGDWGRASQSRLFGKRQPKRANRIDKAMSTAENFLRG